MEYMDITLKDESLTTLLRSNLSSHLGENMTRATLDKITAEIIESIHFLMNNRNQKSKYF